MNIKNLIRIGVILGLVGFWAGCDDDDVEVVSGSIRTAAVEAITETSARCDAKMVSGTGTIDELGICWAKTPNPTVDGPKKSVTPVDQEFTVALEGLRSGTLYYVRSYFRVGDRVIYGDQRSFTTLGQLACVLPFTERFRGEDFLPPYWTMIDQDGDGYNWERYTRFPGALSASYGDEALTPANYLVSPKIEVTGQRVKLLWSVGATSRNYYEEHYKVVVAEEPFTDENCAAIGKVVFEETLAAEAYRNLLAREVILDEYTGKDIYIAWVHGDCSGNDAMYISDVKVVSEENPLADELPQLTLEEAGETTRTTAVLSAVVGGDGGATVTRKGFCYAKTPAPGLEGEVVELYGYEDFSVTVDELEPGTTYYVRAYATNRAGTAYSGEISFTTPETITETLFEEDFTTPASLDRFILIDGDADGDNWFYHSTEYETAARSYSFGANDEPLVKNENYLFLPEIRIAGDVESCTLTFQAAASGKGYYEENFKVVVMEKEPTGANTGEAVVLENIVLTEAAKNYTFVPFSIDLGAYKGKEVYIGFLHVSTDQDSLLINGIKIETQK